MSSHRWNQTVTQGSGPSPSYAFSSGTISNTNHIISGVSYDDAGNMTYDGSYYYTYDGNNRVIGIGTSSGSNNVASYSYNSRGMRVSVTSGGASVEWLFDLAGNALTQSIPGTLQFYQAEYFVGGRDWGTLSTGGVNFRYPDWVGNGRVWQDVAGTVTQQAAYAAFGDGLFAPGGGSCCSLQAGMFDDAWQDSANNTYHTLNREYSPTQGRWLTPDPAGLAAVDVTNPQTWNRYAYVTNNPVSMTDPLGLDSETSSTDSSGNTTDYTTVDVTADLDFNSFAPVFTSLNPNNIGGFDVPGTTVNVTATAPPDVPFNLSPRGQDCLTKVQSAVNAALNTSTTFKGPQLAKNTDPNDPGLINGAYNFDFVAPGVQFGDPSGPDAVPGANCGRFGGSGLHIPVPGGGCNPSHDPTYLPWGFNAQQNGSYFTAHIDSANPFDDLVGFFNHLINDVFLRSHHGC
jgi:RHS repeat-associated protein